MTGYDQTKQAVLEALQTDARRGLSMQAAGERLSQSGENRLRERKKITIWRRFLGQFKDVMILILLAAAAISFAVAWVEKNPGEFFEPALILLIVLLNGILGVVQESRAERALDALKKLSAPHARVIRDGVEQIIDAAALVPGDLIRLEAGDFVPADARLLESVRLKSEESALTGESLPSEKDADADVPEGAALGDRANMLFAACSISYGTALAVVTATGMDTQVGQIALLLQGEGERLTPLQMRLGKLGKQLGILALAACAVIFAIGIGSGLPVRALFMTAVSLAVSAIPEGLPATVTIVLAIGVQRMVKKNAIIRRLPAVETLGNASVICSDKTGTLTQNRMTLLRGFVDGAQAAEALEGDCSPGMKRLLSYGALCSDATVRVEEGREIHIGDPTESAIVLAARRFGMEQAALHADNPRVAALPFDSERKRMSTIHRIDGQLVLITKGAFEGMAERCISGDLTRAAEELRRMSEAALRVLAVGCRVLDSLPEEMRPEELERELHFMGLLGMIDPPRPEAKEAVALCMGAGIRPVMITGDHILTASAIARELAILQEGDLAVTGGELDAMPEEELEKKLTRIAVYARVSPENKIRIVKAWQRRGDVVCMTGDGVNDAPALKAADIGCAMGITGTDVAKASAEMILTDDHFGTIVEAIKQGRGIYANIRKVVGFLLGTNIGELISVFLAMVLWQKTPLISIQLLWINLVTDSLPAIALGMEAVEDGVMREKPKPSAESIFAGGFGVQIMLQGLLFAVLTLLAFSAGVRVSGELAGGQTMAFLVLALSQVAHAFTMRSRELLLRIGPFRNHKLNWAALISAGLTCLVLFTPLRIAFQLILLPIPLYLLALGLILTPVILMELAKAAGLLRAGE